MGAMGFHPIFQVVALSCLTLPSRSQYCTPDVLSLYPTGWPDALDWGIYWFGHGDATERATGQKSAFYDPMKRTVIYFHGWTGGQGGYTSACKRITTRCPEDLCPAGGKQFLVEAWLNAGWNVGFFYWDQFADEDCTRDAEQKIWFDRGGDGFRWRSYDVGSKKATYKDFDDGSVSVADICVHAVNDAMGSYSGPGTRFVGHSIGAQLATKCAAMLHHEGHVAAPGRLALLEPFFTKHHLYFFRCKSIDTDEGIGSFTAAATAGYVKSLWDKHGVVTEVYKSSVLTETRNIGMPNEELEKLVSLVEYSPHWCGGFGPLSSNLAHLECKHSAAFPIYFLSYGFPPPKLNPEPRTVGPPGSALADCSTPSPVCSDAEIREWIRRQRQLNGSQRWTQTAGQSTFEVDDDAFALEPELAQASEVVLADAELTAGSPDRREGAWWTPFSEEEQRLEHSPIVIALVAVLAFALVVVIAIIIALLVFAGHSRLVKSGYASDVSDAEDHESIGPLERRDPDPRQISLKSYAEDEEA